MNTTYALWWSIVLKRLKHFLKIYLLTFACFNFVGLRPLVHNPTKVFLLLLPKSSSFPNTPLLSSISNSKFNYFLTVTERSFNHLFNYRTPKETKMNLLSNTGDHLPLNIHQITFACVWPLHDFSDQSKLSIIQHKQP